MRAALPLLPAVAVLLAPGVVDAGGSGSSCNCAPPPPACCNVSSTHTISIPGVSITGPSVSVGASSFAGGVGGASSASNSAAGASAAAGANAASDVSLSVQASGSASSASSASLFAGAAASSTAGVLSSGSALSTANSQAANLLAASGGGGGFGFSEGVGSTIPNLNVSTPDAATPRQVCVRTAASVQAVAVQAVCLDDKDVPHPASQTMPGQDVPEGWSGEMFRCIAGAHMQYVTAPWAGEARFDHGQTVVCAKGEALWRDAGGRLQCRPQAPARDCNERSLLRRYGAGIKVLKAAVSGQCVEWRTETAGGDASSQGALQLDGGVGG